MWHDLLNAAMADPTPDLVDGLLFSIITNRLNNFSQGLTLNLTNLMHDLLHDRIAFI